MIISSRLPCATMSGIGRVVAGEPIGGAEAIGDLLLGEGEGLPSTCFWVTLSGGVPPPPPVAEVRRRDSEEW